MAFSNLLTLFKHYLGEFSAEAFRYLLFAGTFFTLFYLWRRHRFIVYKIQEKFPANKHMWREVGYSFLSLTIFAVSGTAVYLLRKHGYTKIYLHLADHSIAYFIFSVVAFILIHDTYFYWTHRFMHIKKIYPYVHKVHHMSTNPTPWAAYAFNPIEATMQAAIFPIMVFLIPLHPLAVLAWVLYQTFMNVIGHLGFELFPAGFVSGTISKWSNTSTHHNMHHKHVNCNYGLYFNFWDRIMGTNHHRYFEEFEAIKARKSTVTTQAQVERLAEAVVS